MQISGHPIKDTEFRMDGNLHGYFVRVDNGVLLSAYSFSAYNVGEVVELESGETAVIDMYLGYIKTGRAKR